MQFEASEALQALKAAPCVKPFPIHVVDVDDSDAGAEEIPEKKQASKPKASKRKKQNKKNDLQNKKVEDIPASVLQKAEVEVDALVRAETPDLKYSPGVFSKAKNLFLKELRHRLKLDGKSASDRWMLSDIRSDFLSTMDERELKKRRFA